MIDLTPEEQAIVALLRRWGGEAMVRKAEAPNTALAAAHDRAANLYDQVRFAIERGEHRRASDISRAVVEIAKANGYDPSPGSAVWRMVQQAILRGYAMGCKRVMEDAVHAGHCNQGEYVGRCKYGDVNCPAINLRGD